ncbi:MAG: peptide ABC transporter substrate-binding protein [Nitrospiraceae bacterium]|nr:peptide ABC transporter substrate-binding protein [Nitrospiraceae bacterium]
MLRDIGEGLVGYSASGTLIGGAAESWTISDDGLRYTFRIRDNARWSNGDPLLASDFIYGWKRALHPDFAADYVALFFCIAGAEDFYKWRAEQLATFAAQPGGDAEKLWQDTQERFASTVGLSAPDERTLVVTLRQPTPYFSELAAFAAFSPIHEKTAKEFVSISPTSGAAGMDSAYFREPTLLVCNGPYVLKEWLFKQRVTLDANAQWWNRENMGNDRVTMIVVTEPTSAILRYERGEVDWYPGLPTTLGQAADIVKSGRSDVHYQPAAGTYFYALNCQPQANGQPNPLADVRVRQALSLAVDRKNLVENVTRLNQPIAMTFTPPYAIPGYDAPVEAGLSFDVEKARQLLADAGYPGGKGIPPIKILFNTHEGHRQVATVVARQLASITRVRDTAFLVQAAAAVEQGRAYQAGGAPHRRRARPRVRPSSCAPAGSAGRRRTSPPVSARSRPPPRSPSRRPRGR